MEINQLSEWSLDKVKELLSNGYNEDVWFDFKERLPDSKDSDGKKRLKATVAAFANQKGGFIVFGILDDKSKKADERIAGVSKEIDYPVLLGNIIEKSVVPRPEITFLNPPLEISLGRCLQICKITESFRKPVAVQDQNSFIYPLRTSRGTSHMSYEEVKENFLGYAFMKDKILLLIEELERIEKELSHIGGGTHSAPGIEISLDTISSCLFHTRGFLAKIPHFVNTLQELKTKINLLNADIRSNLVYVPLYAVGAQQIEKSIASIRSTALDIQRDIQNVLFQNKEALLTL